MSLKGNLSSLKVSFRTDEASLKTTLKAKLTKNTANLKIAAMGTIKHPTAQPTTPPAPT